VFVNVQTQIVFPRRVLCFELTMEKVKDPRGIVEMMDIMIKDSTPEMALGFIVSLFDVGGFDTRGWMVEQAYFDFATQSFNYLVSAPNFPIHQEGSCIRRIRSDDQLKEIIANGT
jgi:hypothetical protein